MKHYRIEFIHGRRPADVDPDDLCWETATLDLDTDASNIEQMQRALADREMDADGRVTYRLVEVQPEPHDRWIEREQRFVKVASYRRIQEVA